MRIKFVPVRLPQLLLYCNTASGCARKGAEDNAESWFNTFNLFAYTGGFTLESKAHSAASPACTNLSNGLRKRNKPASIKSEIVPAYNYKTHHCWETPVLTVNGSYNSHSILNFTI